MTTAAGAVHAANQLRRAGHAQVTLDLRCAGALDDAVRCLVAGLLVEHRELVVRHRGMEHPA